MRTCCPNCSQPYSVISVNPIKGKIPLSLPCGDTLCEDCASNIIKFNEPLECNVCLTGFKLSSQQLKILSNVENIRLVFPIHTLLFGNLVLEWTEQSKGKADAQKPEYLKMYGSRNNFIDVQEILNKGKPQKACTECTATTEKMCKQCSTILCDGCFQQIHKSFVTLKSHELAPIGEQMESSYCPQHTTKVLEYYCTNCEKAICMDCTLVGDDSCKSHAIVSIAKKNSESADELKALKNSIDEIFRRLTGTALTVGNLLGTVTSGASSNTELAKVKDSIHRHFAKLHAILQKRNEELIQKVENAENAEKATLETVKEELVESLEKCWSMVTQLDQALDPKNIGKISYDALLKEAKTLLDTPWFLTKMNPEDETSLELIIDDGILNAAKNHISLKEPKASGYTLLPTSKIEDPSDIPPAPTKIVLPAPILRDVREIESQNKAATSKRPDKRNEKRNREPVLLYQPPKFTRAKSGSNSSINSMTSDVSFKTMFSPPPSIAPAVSPTGRTNYNNNVQTVSPFTSINNIPLQKGRNEMIYVSHINDPSDFYVTRACYQSQIKEMMIEFKNAATFPRPQKSHISEGKIFLGYCQAEDMWHRCRIVNIERTDPQRPVCHVFYIDYGQMDHLTVDKLREMAANRKQCPPPLALHCALANCHPLTGVWTQEDTILMNQIINNKSAVMCIRKTLGATCLGLSLECDLVTTEDGVSLAHALVFHERARFTDPNMPYQKIPNLYTRPTLHCGAELKKGETETVMITHVVSPDKFYLRKAYLQDTYEKLLEKLGYTYDIRSSQGKVYYPEIGMAAVCNVDKYGEQVAGGGWRRAVVTALPGKKHVAVLLPDTGHEATVHWSVLRHMHHEFTTLSALSFPCFLSSVSATSKRWSRGSVNLLESYSSRLLKMCVDELPNRRCNSFGVVLYDESGDEPVCVNMEFVKHNYAIPLGPYKLEAVKQEVIKNKAPVKKPMPIPKPKTVKILQKGEKIEKKEKKQKNDEKELEAQDKGPLKLEVKILSCASPSLIYVSILSGHELLEHMYEELQEHYGTKKVSGKETWVKGDPCCVQCNKKKTWRRAVVEEVAGDKARVFYTDFAFFEWVNVADLKILTQDFMRVRDGAVKCHLSGIHPAIGDEWPTITCEYLNELIESYQRFFITKQGVIKDKSLPIELWVYHVTAGGALEPNKHEWRKLNDRILDQGLAIPDRAKLGDNKDANATSLESTEETLAFLNVKGSMSEWLQLAPKEDEDKFAIEPAKTPPEEVPSPGSSEPASPAKKPLAPQPPAERLFSDWLPVILPVDKEFIATPTYVDEEARIYLHDVRQEDTLDMIRKSLNARFGDSEHKPHDIFWSIHQPCIVKYDYDGQYYRGRVLKCHENHTCDVIFVDYGNVETCSVKHMRKNIVMASIPIQAIQCNIPKIKPPSGTWDTKSLDFIHQLIVDKNCLIKVLDEPEKGVVPIDLNLNSNWLTSLLIELEFAIPSDANMMVKTIDPVEVVTPRGSQDSDPDYIVEEESTLCPDSLNDSLEDAKVDWIKMVEESSEDEVTFPTFASRDPPALRSWLSCTVAYIHDVSKLEVTHANDESADAKIEEIIEDIQNSAQDLDPLEGIFDDKACVAWSQEDNKWLRARIIGFDQKNNLVRVKMVDVGNIEMVASEEIRECLDSWCAVPPRTTTAVLNGITISDISHLDKVTEAYKTMFGAKKTLLMQVVDVDKDTIVVDVRETYDGPLVYQDLIDEGILIKSF